ncbi:MAG TPA: beta-galactosidase [Tepidisphaeraceae bacterium]|nr:beta-galactosidase [Tepidisphaeraceae bacterium]
MLAPQHWLIGITGIFILATGTHIADADPLLVDASKPAAVTGQGVFHLGTARTPDGHELTVNNLSLLRDSKPWLPVMGEFHFARYPAGEWKDELLKMKAGGIDIVATYVFWIHHEEVKDKWDWTGQRSLRDFIKTCADVGMPVIVRAGPWCHGEVRNGGQPDYIVQEMGRRARTNDPAYLERVKILYSQIFDQIKGLQWKDGGPIVGMQFENEYSGSPDHLMMLKKIATDLGVDLPIYTKTGWPVTRAQVPFGAMLPLEGAYAEGFWDSSIAPMPGKYPTEFLFAPVVRTSAAIGTDQLGDREAKDAANATQYPYLTCELGGGMMSSYHRRVLIYPDDIASIALIRVGSGSNLPGYYMYHGGTNPDGQLSTMQESQESNYPNDMPVKTYDFQAPLGEFGQVRPHYHMLRRMHMFLHDFGSELTLMKPVQPQKLPANARDTETLRWLVRANGDSGFVFVNNYQRLQPMPARQAVQFDVKLPNGNVQFPSAPITVPADSYFVWPFNLTIGGVKLNYATAQPVCTIQGDGITYAIFAQSKDVPAEFAFDQDLATFKATTGERSTAGKLAIVKVKPSKDVSILASSPDGKRLGIILLDEATSLNCWKQKIGYTERLVLCSGSVIFDGDHIRVHGSTAAELAVEELQNGKFAAMSPAPAAPARMQATVERIKEAGPAREITRGKRGQPGMPTEAQWEQAAVYRLKLPAGIDAARDMLLRIRYTGDVARIYLDGKLLTDNFYYGNAFDVGLKRFGPDIYQKELLLKVLPLRKDAPIYIAKEAWPDFKDDASTIAVDDAELIETAEVVY